MRKYKIIQDHNPTNNKASIQQNWWAFQTNYADSSNKGNTPRDSATKTPRKREYKYIKYRTNDVSKWGNIDLSLWLPRLWGRPHPSIDHFERKLIGHLWVFTIQFLFGFPAKKSRNKLWDTPGKVTSQKRLFTEAEKVEMHRTSHGLGERLPLQDFWHDEKKGPNRYT